MTTADEEWRTKYNFSGNGNASGNGQAPPPGAERTEWEALDLLAHKFPEMVWAVMDLLPAGLAILSGPPKQGKSWLALRLAVCVATGTAFLGHKVGAGRVLYAALEDGARRAKTRLKKMPEHAALAKGLLTIWTVAPRVDEGLLARLETWATAGDGQPPPRLIVLDVFQRVRASKTTGGKDRYAEDYEALSGLQLWANQRGICLLVLHHNRKATGDDPFDAVSGSTGMTGAVDQVLVLRGQRGEKEAALFVTGRDTEQDRDHSLEFSGGMWVEGAMPVDLASASGRQKFARETWRILWKTGREGMTTDDIAVARKRSKEATLKHLDMLMDEGWVEKMNNPGPGYPVVWRPVPDPYWELANVMGE